MNVGAPFLDDSLFLFSLRYESLRPATPSVDFCCYIHPLFTVSFERVVQRLRLSSFTSMADLIVLVVFILHTKGPRKSSSLP